MKPLADFNNIVVPPIKQTLLLTNPERLDNVKDLINEFFSVKGGMYAFKAVDWSLLYLTAILIKETATHVIYVFLYGTKGELLMKEFTFFRTYEEKQIPLTLYITDLVGHDEAEILIEKISFAAKERETLISFKLQELE